MNKEDAFSKEWIVTNGLGSYASSTVCGANTRRYHGLFVPAFTPPTTRYVVVSKVEEIIANEAGQLFSISTNQYPEVIHPDGFTLLNSFRHDPFPSMEFRLGHTAIRKTIWMVKGQQCSVLEYENIGESSIDLTIIPLIVFRDYHQLSPDHLLEELETRQVDENAVIIHRGEMPSVLITGYGVSFTGLRDVYRNFDFNHEKERGLDDTEDCLSIGRFTGQLERRQKIYIVCSLDEPLSLGALLESKSNEIARLDSLVPQAVTDPFLRDLIISGDQFSVFRSSTKTNTLIAGYHWFTDWGRDTMIAMRGLVISRGMQKEARSIIENFLLRESDGLIPNRFPDFGEKPDYNTVDATLWLFVAMYEYDCVFQDIDFLVKYIDRLESIVEAHCKGTRFGIHVGEDGLLYSGAPGYQLTWMDAKVDDYVVTPREGAAVEVNALWYNALCILENFSGKLSKEFRYSDQKEKIRHTFEQKFYSVNGALADVVRYDGSKDDSVRPNMVYALSLPFPILTRDMGKQILNVIEKELYTPYGLRSLSPSDEKFISIYSGDRWARDLAYHQGTVWAFLWGEYALAKCYVYGYTEEVYAVLRKEVRTLEEHFYTSDGIRCISEIFDGMNPSHGRGCIHQAWSVGGILWAFLNPRWKSH